VTSERPIKLWNRGYVLRRAVMQIQRAKAKFGHIKIPSQKIPFGVDVGATMTIICPAGWSSPVAREAHNLEVVGSNPAPAT
jgi:hypothetical protein